LASGKIDPEQVSSIDYTFSRNRQFPGLPLHPSQLTPFDLIQSISISLRYLATEFQTLDSLEMKTDCFLDQGTPRRSDLASERVQGVKEFVMNREAYFSGTHG
jgi:hypothetical protein